MRFEKEVDFETALVNLLFKDKGWDEIIENPTESDLIDNWARILFHNNQEKDRLNSCPLTKGEMDQIMEQIRTLRTPLNLNGFINGKTVTIKRENEDDTLHFGKEVSLKIYDRKEIAAGQSRYQIVRQPKFTTNNHILPSRRGDVMLLINGMPVFHVELKRSGVPVSEAYHQIEKYSREGVFTGLFSLVQVFVAMTPEETVYFANGGTGVPFNSDYYFHWADRDNEPVNDYKTVASKILSIPMAHQIIGFYTVADASDGVLKVMRSYQYFAAHAISDRVSKTDWRAKNQRGGFVWHTTGSGKTMTSFKSAHLIASSGDADKVVFLTDRIELGTQSLKEYQGFAGDGDTVQATENTSVLVTKLKSKATADTLIVTSIQKMSNIHLGTEDEPSRTINDEDIGQIRAKRLVFIVDEAHRSTFGKMLTTIKHTFPQALFFGFTGTPIQEENQKHHNTTSDIFGDELHRYSIADGIRDKNVLGFDPYKVMTFRDSDVREQIALSHCHVNSVNEIWGDPKKEKVYQKFTVELPMYGTITDSTTEDKKKSGIEDYLGHEDYASAQHKEKVVEDICRNFIKLSKNRKFHGMFATSSINEAIEYYRLFKKMAPDLNVTGLFDPNIDNNGDSSVKSDGLVEIYEDYNKMFGQDYTLASSDRFKKDVATRLAHKDHYRGIEKTPEKQLDLLIVVDQMLTGFDSKWVNTLYLDKIIYFANIIQAFSRTNRLFGPDKPFGTVRYYRKPHTMEQLINQAVKLYSGDKPVILFADKLEQNLEKMNRITQDIKGLFKRAGVEHMEALPKTEAECQQFAKLFGEFNEHLQAATLQGFTWEEQSYTFEQESEEVDAVTIDVSMDETMFLTLATRYKELAKESGTGGGDGIDSVPYDLVGYLTEIDTGKIDADYMNHSFVKYLQQKNLDSTDKERMDEALNELHKTFATLTQEQQKFASIFMRDVEEGKVIPEDGKTLRDYITEYQVQSHNDLITTVAEAFGVDEEKLRKLIHLGLLERNLDEFGRYSDLKKDINKEKSQQYLEEKEGTKIPMPKVNIKVNNLLRDFILSGGKKFPYFQVDERESG